MNAFTDEGGKNKHREEIMNVRMENSVRKRAKKGLNAGP